MFATVINGQLQLLNGHQSAALQPALCVIAIHLCDHVCTLLQLTGDITYNGKNFHEFQAVHTAAYVDQNDLHQAELTVRETLDFAARCQGIGHKAGENMQALAQHTSACLMQSSTRCTKVTGVCNITSKTQLMWLCCST